MTSFFTKKELADMPRLYETEHVLFENKQLVAKLFLPSSDWTWYVIESDGKDQCFGLVVGEFPDFGYFTLSELATVRDPLGNFVERDEYFEPVQVKDLDFSDLLRKFL